MSKSKRVIEKKIPKTRKCLKNAENIIRSEVKDIDRSFFFRKKVNELSEKSFLDGIVHKDAIDISNLNEDKLNIGYAKMQYDNEAGEFAGDEGLEEFVSDIDLTSAENLIKYNCLGWVIGSVTHRLVIAQESIDVLERVENENFLNPNFNKLAADYKVNILKNRMIELFSDLYCRASVIGEAQLSDYQDEVDEEGNKKFIVAMRIRWQANGHEAACDYHFVRYCNHEWSHKRGQRDGLSFFSVRGPAPNVCWDGGYNSETVYLLVDMSKLFKSKYKDEDLDVIEKLRRLFIKEISKLRMLKKKRVKNPEDYRLACKRARHLSHRIKEAAKNIREELQSNGC